MEYFAILYIALFLKLPIFQTAVLMDPAKNTIKLSNGALVFCCNLYNTLHNLRINIIITGDLFYSVKSCEVNDYVLCFICTGRECQCCVLIFEVTNILYNNTICIGTQFVQYMLQHGKKFTWQSRVSVGLWYATQEKG